MAKRIVKRKYLPRNLTQKIKLFFGILVGGVIIYYFSFNNYGIVHHFKTKRDLQRLKDKIELLERQQKEINETIRKLKYDRDYLEKQAREKLGLVFEGEEVYIVKESKSGYILEKK